MTTLRTAALACLTAMLLPAVLGLFSLPASATEPGSAPPGSCELPVKADLRETRLEGGLALVLAGGGARGLAHVGALRALTELELPIDLVCGTSMGGLVGGLFASGWSVDELDSLVRRLDWMGYFRDVPAHNRLIGNARFLNEPQQIRLRVNGLQLSPPSHFVRGQKVELLLDDLCLGRHGPLDFLQLPIPFACVATDLETGEAVDLTRGELPRALRATMSLPSIFEPVEWEGRVLVDGGLVQNLPTDLARRLGARRIVAVNLETDLRPREELGDLLAIADQSRGIMTLSMEREQAALADLVIRPELGNAGILDFHQAHELLEAGYAATMARREELLALRDELGGPRPLHTAGRPWPPRRMLLAEIQVEGDTDLSLTQAERVLGVRTGDSFAPAEISLRVRDFVASGLAVRAGYAVRPSVERGAFDSLGTAPALLTLRVTQPRERWLGLFVGYNELEKAIFGFRFDWQAPRGPGTALRFTGRLAGRTGFELDGWRSSFLNSGLYIHPQLHYTRRLIYLHDGAGTRLASYYDSRWGSSLGAGVVLRRGARLETGLRSEVANSVPDVADTSWARYDRRFNGGFLRLEIDTRNAIDLPTDGYQLRAEAAHHRAVIGAHDTFSRWSLGLRGWLTLAFDRFGGTVASEAGSIPYRRGLLTLEPLLAAGGEFNGGLPLQAYHEIGGWPTAPGLARSELWAPRYWAAGLGMRLWLSRGLSLMPSAALLSVEDPLLGGDHDHRTGWGLELAARTFVGPLRISLAATQGRSPLLQLELGWP
jgi:predicted acylesterase/phospholipase RssA